MDNLTNRWHPETSESYRRLQQLAGRDLEAFFEETLMDSADPEASLTNFDRWIRASSNPSTQLSYLVESPRLARLIMILLGASQDLSGALIQNPEIGSLITDPSFLDQRPTSANVIAEGRKLLEVSSGYTHSLDRLRFLRQCWIIRIVVNDLAGTWPQVEVWRSLSELADALIVLAADVSWKEYAGLKGLHGSNPVSIIAFGKLGGHELNYNSDVDLVYALDDEADEGMERHATRYCEMFGRAISDAMGRGALYRIDLRLRPFGASGPLIQPMRAIEAYYRSHAEEWEFQALLRSRVVVGATELVTRWEDMRQQHVFRPQISTMTVEAMLDMRVQIERHAEEADIKRGSGGIRDVEFITQILQRVFGHANPTLQTRSTLESLQALKSIGILEERTVEMLMESYEFLRKLEHRLQIDGKQTHHIPESEPELARLAHLMGMSSSTILLQELNTIRGLVRAKYEGLRNLYAASADARIEVLELLGEEEGPVTNWLDRLPDSNLFYSSLLENADSLRRVRTIRDEAPVLIPRFADSVGLTEALISGEIEEDRPPGGLLTALKKKSSVETLANAARSEWSTQIASIVLNGTALDELGVRLSAWMDAVLRAVFARADVPVDVIALGSYAVHELGLQSDADLLLLVPTLELQESAERAVQEHLSFVESLRQLNVPIDLDLRLRPEGKKGLLVRTYDGFRLYQLASMEMWERFALGQARLVHGSKDAMSLVQEAAYGQPLTPERLDDLLRIKLRIETERVQIKHSRRDVKLGIGGLTDIDWLVRLHEMRYPTATEAGVNISFDDRIRALARARLIHAIERDTLLEARSHLRQVRARIALLGFTPNVLPENPDKLDRIGHLFGFADGNAFLAQHEQVIESVRAIYNEGIERLRA